MAHPRPFRFGVQSTTTGDRHQWVELARKVEDLGYSTLTMPDHFTEQFAPVPALQSAADATTTLRVGALVFDNDYKHPVVLAKEAATIDVLSDGRLEIGLGAGWQVSDYEQSGIPYDRAGVRIDRFLDGLAVIRGALGAEPFSFSGEHYTVTGYNGLPKPVQQPAPPILIGGGGPRVLRIAARQADIVGVNPSLSAGVIDQSTFATATAESTDEKLAIVREAAGERLDRIELNVRTFMVMVTDDVSQSLDALASFAGSEPEAVNQSPYALVGPPSKLVEDLLARRERWGFSYVIIGQSEVEAFAPVVAELAGR